MMSEANFKRLRWCRTAGRHVSNWQKGFHESWNPLVFHLLKASENIFRLFETVIIKSTEIRLIEKAFYHIHIEPI